METKEIPQQKLLFHKTYNIVKGVIHEILDELGQNGITPERTKKAVENIQKYLLVLMDVIVEGESSILLMGRKSRDRGKGVYKQRDKTDVSTKPPKKKKNS